MKIIGHLEHQLCPRCDRADFCDDCGLCKACGFSPPDVDLPHPEPPAPMLACDECGGTASHLRSCSVTRRAAAS
jgi:ribosomal protein L37E